MTSSSSSAPAIPSSISTASLHPAATSSAFPPSPSAPSSPCAACKFLRRKCQPECVFAPYFLADQQQKFINVHRVFGASNVTKLLNEVQPRDREDAVNSLAYEADMRIRDPVYGCVGVISILHHELRKLQLELSFARAELARHHSSATAAAVAAAAAAHPFATAPGDLAAHHGIHQAFGGHEAAEMAARLGVNGVFDGGLAANVGGGNASALAATAELGLLGGHFMKQSAAGVDEKPGIGPA